MAITRVLVELYFSIFLSSTYSRVEYCAGSTEKMEFMRNPAAATSAANVRFMRLYLGIWNWIFKVLEKTLAFHNPNFYTYDDIPGENMHIILLRKSYKKEYILLYKEKDI